jgi:acetyl-CoA carboxylase carboxyltransferase component
MSTVLEVPRERLSEGAAALTRLQLLCDPGTLRSVRTGVGDGVLAGSGFVHGNPVCAWAQDGGFRGGSLGERGGETIARTIEQAARVGVPVVGFPHSAGARLQDGVAALHSYSRIFRAQALAGVPQISVVCGSCAGGAAYSPALGDITLMAGPDARMFVTGPAVVERVTHEQISALELGGPRVHGRNGVAHLVVAGDVEAAGLVRAVLAHLPSKAGGALPSYAPRAPMAGDPAAALPEDAHRVYDVRDVISRLVDGGALLELASRWARNLVVGLALLDGAPVGIVANQPRHLGGCLNAEAAQKGAWFVDLCDRYDVPLVVLVDTPGFLPGVRQEQSGVIRHGASLLRAFSVATTPRVTVTLRQAYGGAHIVMNSRDLGADLTLAWPGARIGVMGAMQAIELVHRRDIAAGADPAALADAYAARHLPVAVAAARGFVDEIVDPRETRERVAFALEARGDRRVSSPASPVPAWTDGRSLRQVELEGRAGVSA